jgi:hypothetical protein
MEFASEKKNPRAKISQKKYRMQLEWKLDKVSRRFQWISISLGMSTELIQKIVKESQLQKTMQKITLIKLFDKS